MITILWHEREPEGYTDLLPEEWILNKGILKARVHLVRGPRSGLYKAKCNVTITASHADLDYRPFAVFNDKNGILLGVMRIQFERAARIRVTQILWKDNGSRAFEPVSTTVGSEKDEESALPNDVDLLEPSVAEGRPQLVTHLKRERKPALVAKKKAAVIAAKGALACEVCAFTFEERYGSLGANYCEIHHRKGLAAGGLQETSLGDLAILCSNCHRMIHRTNPMVSVSKFRETYLDHSERTTLQRAVSGERGTRRGKRLKGRE